MKRTCCLLACVVIVGIARPARAQNEPRPYVRFEFDPNVAKLLKERLQTEHELGPLKDLIKQIAADPSKLPVDPAMLKDFKLEDPKFKKALQDWATRDPQLKQALRDWMKQNPPDKQPANVKQFQNDLQKILDQGPQKIAPPRPIDIPKIKVEPAQAEVDPLAKATQQAMARADNSKMGDWLRDSAAWNRAIKDLRTSINHPNASRLKLGDWNKFPIPQGSAWKLGEGTLDRLRDLPRPNLDRFSPSLPRFGNLRTPNVSAPSLPNFNTPSLPTIGQGLTWVLLVVVFLLIAWPILRWGKRAVRAAAVRAALGPWPVLPEEVATRAELVQAFDYLALLSFGLDVQSWNHRAIARRWREQSPGCAESAQALAQLYEQARYTEGVEALPEMEREQARRSLLELKGAL